MNIMLSRRAFLWAVGGMGVGMGCSEAPAPPTFLTDLKFLTRDGATLPDVWTIPINRPIDPTIQFQIVADHPLEFEGRKVVPHEKWEIIANIEQAGTQLPIVGFFKTQKWYGEEFIGNSQGELIWESPDSPEKLSAEVQWQWCHCRVREPGEYAFVVYLLPTVVHIGGDDTMIDHGTGLEIVRRDFVIEDGERLPKGLTMACTNAEFKPRSVHRMIRKMRKKSFRET